MHLSIFYRRVVVLGENSLLFKRKFYPWSSIQKIEVWQEPWPGIGYQPEARLLPRVRIYLTNGGHFLLRGDALAKRGEPPESGFATVFDEPVTLFREKQQSALRGSSGAHA